MKLNNGNEHQIKMHRSSVKVQRHRSLKCFDQNQPKTTCCSRIKKRTQLQANSCCEIHTSYIQLWIQPTLASIDPLSSEPTCIRPDNIHVFISENSSNFATLYPYLIRVPVSFSPLALRHPKGEGRCRRD